MLNKAMGELDFNKSAVELERLIRGLNPTPSAFSRLNGKTLKIFAADVVEGQTDAVPGTVVAVDKKSFTVQCGQQALRVLEVQLEGKKRMAVSAFLLGYTVTPGMSLESVSHA
jgi:methionyl-tRNA formyltransferase